MKIDSRAILKGTLIFIIFYFINAAFIWFVTSEYFSLLMRWVSTPDTSQTTPISSPAQVATIVINSIDGALEAVAWFVPGYYTGKTLQAFGLAHGAIIGALGYGISFFILSALPELDFENNLSFFDFLYNAVGIALLCSLAGGVGELHSGKGLKA